MFLLGIMLILTKRLNHILLKHFSPPKEMAGVFKCSKNPRYANIQVENVAIFRVLEVNPSSSTKHSNLGGQLTYSERENRMPVMMPLTVYI